jgi:hypothetical protein
MNVDVDIDNLEGQTPEEIAEALFTHEPKEENSCQLISEKEIVDLPYIFEILTIILLEGLEILAGDLSTVNLNNLTCDHISSLNPWFWSLGFNINVAVYDNSAVEMIKKRYCKILIRDKLQEVFFDMKNIKKNYHFLLNGDELEQNKHKSNLKDLYSVFITGDKYFKISFDFHYPVTQFNKTLL